MIQEALGGMEGEGGREGGRDGGTEGGREGGRERGRDGGREGGRECIILLQARPNFIFSRFVQ